MAGRGPSNGRRRGVLFALLFVFAAAGAAWAAWWHFTGRWYESTENAYVAGNVVQVTPQIATTLNAGIGPRVDALRAEDVARAPGTALPLVQAAWRLPSTAAAAAVFADSARLSGASGADAMPAVAVAVAETASDVRQDAAGGARLEAARTSAITSARRRGGP